MEQPGISPAVIRHIISTENHNQRWSSFLSLYFSFELANPVVQSMYLIHVCHVAMGHQINPSLWTHWPISCSSQGCMTGVTSCGICCPVCEMVHIKYPLLQIGKSSLCGSSRFPLSLSWVVFLPYVSRHITINKMCWVCRQIKHFLPWYVIGEGSVLISELLAFVCNPHYITINIPTGNISFSKFWLAVTTVMCKLISN